MSVEFEDWLTQQRWYAGRNRELVSATTAMAVRLRDGLELNCCCRRITPTVPMSVTR